MVLIRLDRDYTKYRIHIQINNNIVNVYLPIYLCILEKRVTLSL